MNHDVVALLLLSEYFAPDEFQEIVEQIRTSKRSIWDVLLENHRLDENTIADLFSTRLKIPRSQLNETIDDDVRELIPEELSRKHLCIPLRFERNKLVLCLANPANLDAIREVEFHSGSSVTPVVASRTEIEAEINRYYAKQDRLADFVEQASDPGELQVASDSDVVDLDIGESRKAAELGPVVKLVNILILEGLKSFASDIHIEPSETEVQIRNRVDGMLRETMVVPKWLHTGLISRIKILANLDIAERRRPQDGRINVNFNKKRVDLRVSTLPTRYGEKVVLRILGSGKGIPSIAQLGLEPKLQTLLLKCIKEPQGMILVTGPTGSGKTTTLYSALARRKAPDINIVTIEDPIEYELPGVNQVQVHAKAGLTFATVLRSILRQDPDVILLGEIRDNETAEIAFHASMTGHMVFSSLHTNSAIATITRLLELDVEPFMVSSCVNLVVAQRLVRKLCPNCKEAHTPPSKLLERLELINFEESFFRGAGCRQCSGSGYSGRLGIYEMLPMTPLVQDAIAQKVSEEELLKIGRKAGMKLLVEDAIEKAKQGMTSLEEILRVVHMREESTFPCPHCNAMIRASFTACPYCTTPLRTQCVSCGQELKSDWKICPYCGDSGKAAESAKGDQRKRWTQ